LTPQKQDSAKMTIAKKFKKEDAKIDWSKTSEQIHNQVRSMTVWPTAVTTFNDKAVKILKTELFEESNYNGFCGQVVFISKDGIGVKTSDGVILITELKPEGKPLMYAYDWTNGAKLKVGDKFI
jgi:methionyl-tRNA formyltransferase